MYLDYGTGRKHPKGFKTSDFTGSPKYDYMIEDYKIEELDDGVVDVLHCRNVIHHIVPEDVNKVIGEFRRLLKKGGELRISEPKKEYFKQNKILDIIWYRYLYYDRDIYLPTFYYDFRRDIEEEYFYHSITIDDFKNEIVIFRKRK